MSDEYVRLLNRLADLVSRVGDLEVRVSRLEEEREMHDRQHAQDGYVRQMEGF